MISSHLALSAFLNNAIVRRLNYGTYCVGLSSNVENLAYPEVSEYNIRVPKKYKSDYLLKAYR